MKTIIEVSKNEEERKLTHKILQKEINISYEKKEYEKVIILSYSLLEDSLLSLLYYLGILEKDKSFHLNKCIDKIIRPILNYKQIGSISKVYKLNVISVKLKILNYLINSNITEEFIESLKKIIESKIGISKIQKSIKSAEEFINLSNEIIHFSFNKNIEDLNLKRIECASLGYEISHIFLQYTKDLEDISLKDKYLKKVNELIDSDHTDLTKYYNALKSFAYHDILGDPKYISILDKRGILEKIIALQYKDLVEEIIQKYEIKHNYDLILNGKEYIKRLINGEIDNIQKKVHDKYQYDCLLMFYLTKKTNIYRTLKKEYKNNLYFIKAAIEYNANNVRYITKEYKNNKEIILASVNLKGNTLRYASKELKDDIDVVKSAILNDSEAIEFASDNLKNNKEIALYSIKRNGLMLKHLSNNLKDDKEIILTAIKNYPTVLRYATDHAKNDKEIVLLALKKDPTVLKYVSSNMQNDYTAVSVSVKSDGRTLKYASSSMRNNKEIALIAVRQYGQALKYVSDNLKNDYDIVLEAVKSDGHALRFATDALKNNKKIALEAVNQYGSALKYVSADLKNDFDVIIAAIKKNSRAIVYVSKELRKSKELKKLL